MESYAYWIISGLLLAVLEMVLPAFIFIFFGIAAILVGTAKYFGLIDDITWELTLFAVLSAIQIFVYRKFLTDLFGNTDNRPVSSDSAGLIGGRAIVLDPFVDGIGSVSFRGSSWKAQSNTLDLEPATRVRVIGSDGIWLFVTPESDYIPE